ncbi:MAG: LysR family transcriptional regulator [Myxococcota bacterium]
MSTLDLDSLRCFVVAAEKRHFRLAARTVGLSPAAFSDRIKRLEASMDAILFDRTTRSVALTASGERLLPEARRCLAQAQVCMEAVADPDRQPPYSLLIGTRFELGLSWIVPALTPLNRMRPERTLGLSFGQSVDLMARLRASELDAFVSSSRLTRSGLRYATLHPERYVFVGEPECIAERPIDGPADAAAHTLIDATPSLPLFRYLLDGLGQTSDWPFENIEHLGTIAAIRHRVRDGHGVAVLPEYFVRPDLETGRLVQLMPEAPMREDAFRLIWRAGDPNTEKLRALADDLRTFPLR